MRKRTWWVVAPMVGLLGVACADAPTAPSAVLEVDAPVEKRAEASLKEANGASIVDVAIALNSGPGPFAGDFDVLLAAVTRAGLVDDLDAVGQRTVFAPTDDAFLAAGIDEAAIAALPLDALTDILLYHVAPGARTAADVVETDRIRMLNGSFAEVEVSGLEVRVDGALVVVPDVMTSNGIIHVVGGVLLP